MTFKEDWIKKWNAEDKRCPACNQVTEIVRGVNKQNLKRLVFQKPTAQDLIIFFMLVSMLLLAWRYNVETETCRYSMAHIDETCLTYKMTYVTVNTSYVNPIKNVFQDINLTGNISSKDGKLP